MQTLRQAAVARASTSLNITQQVGASIGTAVLSVLLANAISLQLGGASGGIGAAASVPPDQRAQVADKLAAAFGSTYWWALGLVVVAFAIATPLLPKQKPAPVEDPAADPGTPAPVLVHYRARRDRRRRSGARHHRTRHMSAAAAVVAAAAAPSNSR